VKFLVPPRLRSLSIELRGKVRVQSQSRDQWLSASTAVSLNKIDTTSQILGLHLLQSQGRYLVEVVGKNGELRAQVPVSVAVTTRWAAAPVTVNLQTNEIGQVSLGALSDVQSLSVSAAGAESRTWNLDELR